VTGSYDERLTCNVSFSNMTVRDDRSYYPQGATEELTERSAPRLQKRKRVTWNPKMRVLGYKIGKSFVMCGGGYRSRYEEYKEE